MTRFVTRFAAAAGLALMASTVWAQSPSLSIPTEVEGKVRYVFEQQQEIEMADGTILSATSPQQLAQVRPGTLVKIVFVDDGRRKEIESVEIVAQ
jgi:hypothetical protein